MPIPRVELLPSGRHRGIATVDGRRRSKTFATEGEAFVWADTLMRKADRARVDLALATPPGASAVPAAPTLEEFLPVFLNSRMVEPETVDNYKSIMQAALREFGHRPLRDGEFDHLELKTWVANMSRLRGKDKRSPRTIAARLKALRSLFTEAVRAGYLTSDPTAGIKLPKQPTRPFRIIEWDEEPALLEAVTAEDLLEETLLAIDAGLRWGEVYGLHIANVNRLRRQLDVTDVLARPDFLPRPYPKGKKTRPVPMTQRLTDALETLMDTGKGVIRCPDHLGPAERPRRPRGLRAEPEACWGRGSGTAGGRCRRPRRPASGSRASSVRSADRVHPVRHHGQATGVVEGEIAVGVEVDVLHDGWRVVHSEPGLDRLIGGLSSRVRISGRV